MIVMRRSTVNRPRSALRMREKSAAAMPVRTWALRTLRRSRSSGLDDLGRENPLKLLDVRIRLPKIAEDVPAPADDFKPFFLHRNISLERFRRS